MMLLFPTRRQRNDAGRLLWNCTGAGRLEFEIFGTLPEMRSQAQPMIWTFDDEAPDTSGLRRLAGLSWNLGDENAAAGFTRRAKSASRLVIRLPDAAAGSGVVYEYSLAGADSALDRLECIRNPRPVREVSDTAPAASGPPDEGTYELNTVEELPSLLNGSDFSRALGAGYPPLQGATGVRVNVEARFRLLWDGSVDSTSITITRSDNEQFNEPSINAIRILRFRPAKVNGRPVNVWITLPIVWMPPEGG
ncbi:MAG TPA: energy transducer TonB [Longimicrobium sp.]|nr:energy transducer TonB [Longimicrobium sp.]